MRMSETARLGVEGVDVHEAAFPPVSFEAFFEQERDLLYRALWLVTRNRYYAFHAQDVSIVDVATGQSTYVAEGANPTGSTITRSSSRSTNAATTPRPAPGVGRGAWVNAARSRAATFSAGG
jgi:hypothetical protein